MSYIRYKKIHKPLEPLLTQTHTHTVTHTIGPGGTHPDVEFYVLVGDSLHVEAHCGDGRHGLAQLQLVEDSWGSKVKARHTHHQTPHHAQREQRQGNIIIVSHMVEPCELLYM